MEEKMAFEQFLFGDGKEVFINDMEFCVDRIIMFMQVYVHMGPLFIMLLLMVIFALLNI